MRKNRLTFISISCMIKTIKDPDAWFSWHPDPYTIVSHGFSIHMHTKLPCTTCLVYHISHLTDKLQ